MCGIETAMCKAYPTNSNIKCVLKVILFHFECQKKYFTQIWIKESHVGLKKDYGHFWVNDYFKIE